MKDRLDKAVAVLKAIEWRWQFRRGRRCPVCDANKSEGHVAGCVLAEVLAGDQVQGE
jgi:hypothetical protein